MATQAQENFAVRAKTVLLKRGTSIKQLAAKIERPRLSVSSAINQGKFPRILKLMREELGL